MTDEVPAEEPEVGADASPEPTPEVEDADAESTEVEAEESEAESPPAEETEDKPNPVQARIDELTRLRREAERERDQLREQLKARPTPEEPVELKTLADFGYDELEYQKYLRAESEEAGRRAAEKYFQEADQQRQQKQRQEAYAERERQFARSTKDFSQVVYDENLKISGPMTDVIMESEIGPQMAYHLGKNPEEAARIAGMSAAAAGRELGRLETRLQAEMEAKSKKVSDAPPPPGKVKGSDPGKRISTTSPESDKLSDDEWFAREAARKNKLMG